MAKERIKFRSSSLVSSMVATDMASYSQNLIKRLQSVGKIRTAEKYTTSMNSFGRFLNGKKVRIQEIDDSLIQAYEAYLKVSGLCPNSISFYLRNLRSIYNRAVDDGFTQQQSPFRHVYTGIDKTVKRALTLSEIRRIMAVNLSHKPQMELARDMFLFSFYTRGMPFVDMAFLKKSDLRNGIFNYRRMKTGQGLFILWEKPMQAIVDRYSDHNSEYLLPIIKSADGDVRRQYKNVYQNVNKYLKKLGELLGLHLKLTTYVARHSWASIAKSRDVSISVISKALGHNSETTTRIYLESIDNSAIDDANRLILRLLNER